MGKDCLFDSLSNRLGDVFDRLRGRGALSEADISAAMREVRVALLEADVALEVVKSFIDKVRERAVGQEVTRSVTPGQQVIKIVNDNLIEVLGTEPAWIELNAVPPVPIMMVGLQGGGKTTSTAKIAARLTNRDKNKVLETVKTSHQIQVLKNGFSIDLVNKMLSEMELKAEQNPKSIEYEVLMLSNLLRYKLYESSAPTVSLNKELDIVKDQINLHNSLFNTNFNLVNQLESDLSVKTGKLLNAVDEYLKNYPKENLELVLKADNNQCFLTAINEAII